MQEVKIKIITTQEVDDQHETMEMVTDGTIEDTPAVTVIRYSETDEEGNTFHTSVSVDKATHRIEMDKVGPAESHMTIEKGKRHHSIYNLGPCDFNLGVYGEAVECCLNEIGGSLKMRYTLDINGTYASRNTVELFVEI